MNLKIALLPLFLLSSFLTAQIPFKLGIDYGLGFFSGIRTPLTKNNPCLVNVSGSDLLNESNLTWQIGGFVGVGALFECNFPFSIGTEYSYLFICQSSEASTIAFDISCSSSRSDIVLEYYIDSYYKIELNRYFYFPIDWQINIGVGARIHLSTQTTLWNSLENRKTLSQSSESDTCLGLHIGSRLNLSLFFIGFDYLLFPKMKNSRSLYEGENSLADHSFSFNIGLVINQGFIENLFYSRKKNCKP